MGGFGSGRHHYSGKSTTDDYLRLDIRKLHRDRLMTVGHTYSLRWSSRGEEIGSIQTRREYDCVVLMYRHRRPNDDWKSYEYRVFLDWTPCNYGGERFWFICPAQGCTRRVAILYGGPIFACRHCHQLGYESQHEAPHSRALRRAQAVRQRLGGSGSLADSFPDKPKGMHWRTYQRLRLVAEDAESCSWPPSLLRAMSGRLLSS